MAKFFYECDCGNNFNQIIPSRYDGEGEIPPSEEEQQAHLSKECSHCLKEVRFSDFLPKRSRLLIRSQISKGRHKGEYITL